MSIEATLAVLEGAEGTDAEWRLLMLLAMQANAEGLVAETSIAALAPRMGRSARGVAGVKKGLKESGQLVIVQEDRDGRRGTYRLALSGLGGPDVQTQAAEAPGPELAQAELPGTPAGRPPGMKAKDWAEFWEETGGLLSVDLDAAAEQVSGDGAMLVDALDLHRQNRKVDGQKVTPRELAIAATALAAFNRCFQWQGKEGSDYGLGANLTQVVMRIRDRASWDAAAHVRLVESAWRVRWWERESGSRRPTPNVIWSQKSFEQVVQDAIAEKEAEDKGQKQATGRRFTRSGA